MKFKKENVQVVYDGVVKTLQELDDGDKVALDRFLFQVDCRDETVFTFRGNDVFLSQAVFFAYDELLKADFAFGRETLKMLITLTALKEEKNSGEDEEGEDKDENIAH